MIKKADGFSDDWEKVSLTISKKNGLQLKKANNVIAKVKEIKELWTRLEIVGDEEYLVVKTFLGFSKYELGIPVHNNCMKWMHAFCSLLKV